MAVKGQDQVTIVDVTDAYTVNLSNDSTTFPGSETASLEGSATTTITALLGGTQIPANVVLAEITKPSGITITKDSNTTSPTLTIAIAAGVTSAGTITIPVHVGDDVTFEKVFSFALALKGGAGSPGADGRGQTGSTITYQAGTSGTTPPTDTWSSTIPTVPEGQFLWTRTIASFNQAPTSATSYSVAKNATEAITVSITSSNGFIFKNSSIVTVLTAHVFKGGVELSGTPLSDAGTISWYKDGGATAVGIGQTLTINAGDVSGKATYVAKLDGPMAVKASASVTLMAVVDVASTTRYYRLQSSTATVPTKPTVNPPSGWVTTEPAYTAGETNSLYTCDLTGYSDGTWFYSDVRLSSSYEAAKDAYNKAVVAAKTATDCMDFGADGLVIGDMTSGALAGNVRIASDGIELRDGTSVLARLKAELLELAANSVNAIIKLCGGLGTIRQSTESFAGSSHSSLTIESTESVAVKGANAVITATGSVFAGNFKSTPADPSQACGLTVDASGNASISGYNAYVYAAGTVDMSGERGVSINGQAVADHVVAYKTAAPWTCTDWASGRRVVEYHGGLVTGALNSTGNMYVSNVIEASVPAAMQPLALTGSIISADNDSLGIIGKTTTAAKVRFRVMSWYNTGSITAMVDMRLTGTWK